MAEVVQPDGGSWATAVRVWTRSVTVAGCRAVLNRPGFRGGLHRTQAVQRCDQRTRAYLHRRTTEGKTQRETIRCLKRYVAREIQPSSNHPRQATSRPLELDKHRGRQTPSRP